MSKFGMFKFGTFMMGAKKAKIKPPKYPNLLYLKYRST